jgi:four helix bundle protein
MRRRLDHEKLEVYRVARELCRNVEARGRRWRGRPDLIEQARRSASAIPLNVAEGGGEFARKEKARFYRIARRSADELSAALDVLVDAGVAREEELVEARDLIVRVVSMLVKLIKTMEGHAASPHPPVPPTRNP